MLLQSLRNFLSPIATAGRTNYPSTAITIPIVSCSRSSPYIARARALSPISPFQPSLSRIRCEIPSASAFNLSITSRLLFFSLRVYFPSPFLFTFLFAILYTKTARPRFPREIYYCPTPRRVASRSRGRENPQRDVIISRPKFLAITAGYRIFVFLRRSSLIKLSDRRGPVSRNYFTPQRSSPNLLLRGTFRRNDDASSESERILFDSDTSVSLFPSAKYNYRNSPSARRTDSQASRRRTHRILDFSSPTF